MVGKEGITTRGLGKILTSLRLQEGHRGSVQKYQKFPSPLMGMRRKKNRRRRFSGKGSIVKPRGKNSRNTPGLLSGRNCLYQ